MIYNNVSIKQVIAKVLTDNDMQEEVHRVADMLTWASEAMEKIGAFPSTETFVTGKGGTPFIKLSNYQAQLPIGLHNIIQVAYSDLETGPYYPMRYSTGSFDSAIGITTETVNEDDTITYGTKEEPTMLSSYNIDRTYVITPGYIKTNQKQGFLMMAYTAIPLDEEGYPLIPDHISFIEALYWYITMKLLYPMWKMGKIRDEVYYDARRSWNYYCKQAYGVALSPNIDQMEAIKNTWNRLVPEMNEHNTFFSTLGQEQIIRNHNRPYGKGQPILY